MIRIGSLFAGIGGFELGLERAIPNSSTIWQVEQNTFCQKVLKKHWPEATIYNDVRDISADNVEPIDILCGGFPCQDISLAGKGEGLNGEKSGLWFEMLRIISELRPRVAVMENVAAITIRGGCEVIGSLASIGYDAEWTIISARDVGAPHLRRRWFCIATDSDSLGRLEYKRFSQEIQQSSIQRIQREKSCQSFLSESPHSSFSHATDSDSTSCERECISVGVQQKMQDVNLSFPRKNYWRETSPISPICRMDDGIPDRVDRLRALGNAIVPQCSEMVGKYIFESGLLQETK